MNRIATITPTAGLWALDFQLADGPDGALLEIRAGESTVLTAARGDMLRIEIHTVWNRSTRSFGDDPSFTFALTSPKRSGSIRLCWRSYSFRLYIDGHLEDEEWPMGQPADGTWDVWADASASGFSCAVPDGADEDCESLYTAPFQNFVLPGHNTGVGDCMPFARDGRYCLYYLLDRRGHRSKAGMGAHQWAQASSADLKNWTLHPMAVGITDQMEGSICTGSLIQKDGQTYAFYAVRMADGSPAQLTWSVSDDGVHFQKSGRTFALTAPYEPVSARDPMVFLGADGLYHMLVTTSLVDMSRNGGCLAHLTSTNLTEWTQHGPFIVPGAADQPECSDYFEWNGWYYLVFSNFAVARYRMSRAPFGPWTRPENDALEAMQIQVPKTAAFGDRRFITGFLAHQPGVYAGNAVTHELFQRADGTLGVRQLEEILPLPARTLHPEPLSLDPGSGRAVAELPAMAGDFRLKARLVPGASNALVGLTVRFSNDARRDPHSYRLEFDPAARTAAVIRPREDDQFGSGREQVKNLEFSGGVDVDLLLRGNILDVLLSDGRAITVRLKSERADIGSTVEFYAIGGTLSVADIELIAL